MIIKFDKNLIFFYFIYRIFLVILQILLNLYIRYDHFLDLKKNIS
jgi:hypothetical protein